MRPMRDHAIDPLPIAPEPLEPQEPAPPVAPREEHPPMGAVAWIVSILTLGVLIYSAFLSR